VRILLAIVHYWNPEGSGEHGSLRPDPAPRIRAIQDQLLSLQRMSDRQAQLNISMMSADPVNRQFHHTIDIKVITDGKHHVLDQLDQPYRGLFQMVVANPDTPKHLGFEAQRFLSSRLDEDYDLYAYFEDDLVILDPGFFRKIDWFRSQTGDHCLLLPHRVEYAWEPNDVQCFFIDGPMPDHDLRNVIPSPAAPVGSPYPGGMQYFESPRNPHSGCFVLGHDQLQYWAKQSWWQDGDCSLVSPLESAATLGIAKTFSLYKPVMAQASWLEIKHWGTSFHCLIGESIALPRQDDQANQIKDSITESQAPN